GVSPGVLLTDDLDLGCLLEAIHRHHFAIIIERGHAGDLSGSDVDELVGVQRPVVVGDVESATGRYHLDVWIERAVIVGEIESLLHRESLAAANVGEPHDCTSYAGTRQRDVLRDNRVSANPLIGWRPDDLGNRGRAVEIDGSDDRTSCRNCDDLVGLRCGRDYGGS